MYFMFWVWLAVIVATAITEFCTLEVVSIWFTLAAIIPLILSATVPAAVGWELEILIFVVLSAVMLISLRGVTKRYLLKNSNEKTNVDALVGRKLRMLSRTDFETLGSARVNDVTWSVLGLNQQTIEKDTIVEVVKVAGNRLIVKPCKDEEQWQSFGAQEDVETKEEVVDTADTEDRAKAVKAAKAVNSAKKGAETVVKTEKTEKTTEKGAKNKKANNRNKESDENKGDDKNDVNEENENEKDAKVKQGKMGSEVAAETGKENSVKKESLSKKDEKSLKKDEKTVKNTKKTAKNVKKTEKSTKKSSKK